MEKFSIFSGCVHMIDDLRNKLFVFFFRILHVENAKLGAAETEATEAIFHVREAAFAIEKIADGVPTMIGEEHVIHAVSPAVAFVAEFAVQTEHTEILAIFGTVRELVAVGAMFQRIAVEAIAARTAFQ